jgi:hypothetical protein
LDQVVQHAGNDFQVGELTTKYGAKLNKLLVQSNYILPQYAGILIKNHMITFETPILCSFPPVSCAMFTYGCENVLYELIELGGDPNGGDPNCYLQGQCVFERLWWNFRCNMLHFNNVMFPPIIIKKYITHVTPVESIAILYTFIF